MSSRDTGCYGKGDSGEEGQPAHLAGRPAVDAAPTLPLFRDNDGFVTGGPGLSLVFHAISFRGEQNWYIAPRIWGREWGLSENGYPR